MVSADIIDYAMPLLKIEALLRQIHEACLSQEYDKAERLCPLVAVETRVLSASLAIMQEAKR